MIWLSADLRCEIQVIWLSTDVRFKWFMLRLKRFGRQVISDSSDFGCQLISDSNERGCQSICDSSA